MIAVLPPFGEWSVLYGCRTSLPCFVGGPEPLSLLLAPLWRSVCAALFSVRWERFRISDLERGKAACVLQKNSQLRYWVLGGVGDGCAEVYVPGGVLRPLYRVRQGSDANVLPLWRGGDYASFLFSLLLASGILFQVPLLLCFSSCAVLSAWRRSPGFGRGSYEE